jgi:hypothetical protein
MDDVHELKTAMQVIRKSATLAFAKSIRVKQGVVTFSRLTNERFDRMQAILEQEHKSITELNESVKSAYDTAFVEFNALGISLTEIQSFSQIYTDLSALDNALEQLLQGILTPTLIPVTQMKEAFTEAASKLAPDGRTLCYTTVQQIYGAKNVLYVRHHTDLLIRLKIPYTSMSRFMAYQSILFDLPVNSKQGFRPRLETVTEFFVSNIAENKIGVLHEKPTSDLIPAADVKWQFPYTSSCLSDIIPALVRTSRSYSVVQDTIPSNAHRIAPNRYITILIYRLMSYSRSDKENDVRYN